MKLKELFLISLFIFLSAELHAQKITLGDKLKPSEQLWTLTGISSKTGVSNYKYIGRITDKMFDRQIGDITIGIKIGVVVTTVYLLIPKESDNGVPAEIVKLVEQVLTYPLAYRNGYYGVNIDNSTITLGRINNEMSYYKDRIMYFSSVKYSLLTGQN